MGESAEQVREPPAALVIRLLGVKRLAFACDLTSNAIHKWEEYVPSKHMGAILDLAQAEGIDLTPADLIYGRQALAEAQP